MRPFERGGGRRGGRAHGILHLWTAAIGQRILGDEDDMAAAANLLLIFTDMQRWDTIHALGNGVIRTPAWDRLVREGTAFTSCYSPSPVCVSARYAMHYGRWPSATGITENMAMLADAGDSAAAALGRAGYRTHAVGKLHFSPDAHALRGFGSRDTQEEIVSNRDRDDYLRYLLAHGYGHVCDPHGARGEMYYIPQIAQMPADHHPTQWVADRALDFMRAQAADSPWMLMASFIHPHPPFAPPNPWHKLYRSVDMPLPSMPQDHEALLTWVNRLQNRYKYRDQGLDQHLLRMMKAYYYATISFVDMQIGRMVDALAERGALEDTLILVTSDHGEFLGDLGCFGKRSMHDPSTRVPLVARLPGRFQADQRVDQPVSLIDIPVTLLAAADAAGATGMHGVDLAEVARGRCPRTQVFSHCGNGKAAQYMALEARWKYIYSAPDQREWLFDRQADPHETRNRIGLPSTRAIAARMRAAMLEHLSACNAAEAVESTPAGVRRFIEYERLELPSDPDSGLLIQDHPWAIQDIEG